MSSSDSRIQIKSAVDVYNLVCSFERPRAPADGTSFWRTITFWQHTGCDEGAESKQSKF